MLIKEEERLTWITHLMELLQELDGRIEAVFDRLEDGTGHYPDGTPIAPLMPLPDRPAPPPKDDLHPGYPNFIHSQFGQEPKQPPLGILTAAGENKIEPTPLERQISYRISRREPCTPIPAPAIQTLMCGCLKLQRYRPD